MADAVASSRSASPSSISPILMNGASLAGEREHLPVAVADALAISYALSNRPIGALEVALREHAP